MEPTPGDFRAFSTQHLVAIFLTVTLPFLFAWIVRRSGKPIVERAIVFSILALLVGNYLGYLIFIRRLGQLSWTQMLPMQMCDWAMAVIIVALIRAATRS